MKHPSIRFFLFAACAALLLALCLCSLTGCFGGETEEINGITYNLNGEGTGYNVTRALGDFGTDIVIPDTYEGLPVVGISDGAFYGCSNMRSLVIPASVNYIGSRAFAECSNLKTVTINGSIREIKDETFMHCTALTDFTIPSTVEKIGEGAFFDCYHLYAVTLPAGLTEIGEDAFRGCHKLIEVQNLSSIRLDNYYSEAGYVAYYAEHIYSNGRSKIENIDGYIFYSTAEDTVLLGYIGEETDLVLPERDFDPQYPIYRYAFYGCDELTSITMHEGITAIDKAAFTDCTGLSAVRIENPNAWCRIVFDEEHSNPLFYAKHLYLNGEEMHVLDNINAFSSIEDFAFINCESLIDVTLPNGMEHIGHSAFYGCTNLVTVSLPETVETLSDRAFSCCKSLTAINMPESISRISYAAFQSCESLKTIVLPNNVTEIPEMCFSDCTSLESAILGVDVEKIGRVAFLNCKNLQSIVLSSSITRIEESAFGNCTSLWDTNGGGRYIGSWLVDYVEGATSVTLRPGTVGIADGGLSSTDSKLTSITLSEDLQYIGANAFAGCYKVGNFTLPDHVLTIGDEAFSGCHGLTSVTIPANVTSIGSGIFANCKGLTSISVAPANTTYHSASDCVIHTEDLAVVAGCKTSVIPDDGSVIRIYKGAFYSCSGMTYIVIPRSIRYIADYALHYCSDTKSIYYLGSPEDWSDVNASIIYNSALEYSTFYYYSESAPVPDPDYDFRYWHYVSGKPTPW